MFRQIPPGEGGAVAPIQFSYEKTLSGQTWAAYLAGPPELLWCHTHREKPTKPCLSWITHGALTCSRCAPSWAREQIAYVPVYRESDHKPCVVIVKQAGFDLLTGLEFGDYVNVTRASGDGNIVVVTRASGRKKWHSSDPRKRVAATLEYSLLQMWKINELTEWCRCRPGGTIVPPAAPAARPAGVPEGATTVDVNRVGDIIARNAADKAARAEAESVIAKTLQSWGKPSENGDHKPK